MPQDRIDGVLFKRVSRGERIPAWYGVAWEKWDSDSAMCMPILLNVIAAYVRGAWTFLRWGHLRCPVNPREAYSQGFRDGKLAAKKEL